MNRLDIPKYLADVESVASLPLDWEALRGTTVAVSGATGMIGALLVDVLLSASRERSLGLHVVAIGRNEDRAKERLPHFGEPGFSFLEADVAQSLPESLKADYFLHLASPTHPRAYSSDPIGTVRANVDGLENMLEATVSSKGAGMRGRLLLASSVEVYGENRGDIERFGEDYLGYIDCNTLRACYTEAKRLGEALCQAYRVQRGVEAVVARIARVYGPTLLPTDSKALSQFIGKALAGEDVVLKSAGTQRYSYLHAADAVSGLLTVLLLGADGGAYNLADPVSDVRLRDLAATVARAGGVGVEFGEPDPGEAAGYSKATLALMDGSKARSLGWRAHYGIEDGIAETLEVLRLLWNEGARCD